MVERHFVNIASDCHCLIVGAMDTLAVKAEVGLGQEGSVRSAKATCPRELEYREIADAATIVLLASKLIRETSLTSKVACEVTQAIELVGMSIRVLVEFLAGTCMTEGLAMAGRRRTDKASRGSLC